MSDREPHQASIDASEASIPAENGSREVENDPPPLGRAEESVSDAVMDVGAHSVIYVSPPKSSIEITVTRIVHWKSAKRILVHSSIHHFTCWFVQKSLGH